MKIVKITMLIITLIFTFTSCAEFTNESTNITENTEVSKEENSFMSPVILLREVIKKGTNTTNKTVYDYDDQNRVISKKLFEDNKLCETTIIKYDENGFKNYEKISSDRNDDYTEESWTNSPTRKVLTLERKTFSSGILYQSTLVYTYDEKDRIITMINKDDKNKILSDFTYEYLDENDSVKITTIRNGVKTTAINIFNAAGNHIEYQIIDKDGNVTSGAKYEYDKNNNVIKEIREDKITTYVYEYDCEKIKKKSLYDNKNELLSSYEFTYNEAGDLIKQVNFDASGTKTSVTEYIYR